MTDAWSERAIALRQMEEWKRLLDWCREWTKSEPQNAEAWNSLGVAYGKINRKDDAIEAYRQALRINPDHLAAWINLKFTLRPELFKENETPLITKERKMTENSIQRGQNYLQGVIVIIVLLQIITNIMEEIPLVYALIRMSVLFVLFNFLLKGYSWSKWILSIYLLGVGIAGMGMGLFLIINRSGLQNNLFIGINAVIIGFLYILLLIIIQILKDIRIFYAHQKENREKTTTRNHLADSLFYIGIAVIVCVEAKMLPALFYNVIVQPQLIKKLLGRGVGDVRAERA